MGYEVYVAVVSVPPEEAHAAAVELGRRWKTLGGSDACSAVIVYAAREQKLAVAADRALEESVLLAKVKKSIEQAPFASADRASADAVVSALVGQLSGVLDVETSNHYKLVQQGAAIVLYGISSIIGLVATGLLVFCLYDVLCHWFHASRYANCKKKVKRVHEAFLSLQGELSLCPYCVTSVSGQPSSSHAVFHCGHRFHIECANRWFAEDTQNSKGCAICEGGSRRHAKAANAAARLPVTQSPDECVPCGPAFQPVEAARECGERLRPASVLPQDKEAGEVVADCPNAEDEEGQDPMNSVDEAKNFMLQSLCREYPDIINKECLERWGTCHTEIWLAELRCPRYKSIFSKHSHK
jgi:hypothetical protein